MITEVTLITILIEFQVRVCQKKQKYDTIKYSKHYLYNREEPNPIVSNYSIYDTISIKRDAIERKYDFTIMMRHMALLKNILF